MFVVNKNNALAISLVFVFIGSEKIKAAGVKFE